MTKKFTMKRIIFMAVYFVVAVALIVGMAIGESFAWQYAMNVNRFLGITKDDFSNATAELAAGDKLVTEVEEESIVLFKNKELEEGKTYKDGTKTALPLGKDVKAINVFGAGAYGGFLRKGVGSGSTSISPQKEITLIQALNGEARDYDLIVNLSEEELAAYGANNDKGEFVVANDKKEAWEAAKKDWAKNNLVQYEVNQTIAGVYSNVGNRTNYNLSEPNLNDVKTAGDAAENKDVALFVLSRNGGENIGEIPNNYLEMSDAEKSALKYVGETFDKVIVLLNTTNMMHLGFLEDAEYNVDACIYVGLTGQSGARAIPEVLSGKINPSGRITDIVTKSKAVAQSFDPTWANHENPKDHGYNISYVEDIYYGYKWYETADYEAAQNGGLKIGGKDFVYDDIVAYPFGFGLSYTTFKQEVTSWPSNIGNNAGAELTVKVKVTNIGDVAGKDVVQLYYTPEYYAGEIEKAYVNLLDFGKTKLLQPGESDEVTLTFTPYDMASYDAYDKNANGFWGYELDAGKYELKLMNNSHELIDSKEYNHSGLKIAKDPVTNEEVKNRFTGKDESWSDNYNGTSYAGLGTDGYEGGVSRSVWFTRENFSGTFPTKGYAPTGNVVSNANEYMNDDYADRLPKAWSEDNQTGYKFDQDSKLYLVYWAQVDDEGNPIKGTEQQATKDQLDGTDKKGVDGKQLVYNWELIEKLAERYDSELWDTFLNQMSIDEMKNLIELGGFKRIALESVGKRYEYDFDGPAGYNTASISGNWDGDSGLWTAYTSEALMGCCWNKTLMLTVGLQQGAEASVTNVNGWYAPGVNLHRSPYTARNYEYYSEDGVLSGKLAANVILGAKANGLNCYIKHFACSEEGPNPGDVNTWLTEQNLRENYLRPFEIAVKEGKSNSLMTAFNRVGASWAGANYAMNVEVLRDEWGFRGGVITDWTNGASKGGMYSRQGVRAGNDLWLNNKASLGGDLNKNEDAPFMRNSAHNLLYTTVDTLNTYRQCQNSQYLDSLLGAENQELYLQYRADLGISFTEVGHEWWKDACIALDVIVGLGIVVGALFVTGVAQMLIGMLKKKPQTEGAEANENAAEAPVEEETAQPEVKAETAPKAEDAPEVKVEAAPEAEAAPQKKPRKKKTEDKSE